MTSVRELHNGAMALAQRALSAREAGSHELSRALSREAVLFDVRAAERIPKDIDSEPTRSILYQSAASLAYHAGDLELAERMVIEGLSGYPPARVRQELKDLYDQVNFASHLAVRGVELRDQQFQFSLAGRYVGAGQMTWTDFNRRAITLFAMFEKVSRRLMGARFVPRGGSQGTYPFVPLVSSPRIGSFAMTVELGVRHEQLSLLLSAEQVIDSVTEGLALIQSNDLDTLSAQIGDEDYFTHFVQNARQLAPDGDRVTLVALTSPRRRVGLDRTRDEMPLVRPGDAENGIVRLDATGGAEVDKGRKVVQGVLESANLRGNKLRVSQDSVSVESFWVQEGMIEIVRSYFGSNVEVVAIREKRRWLLLDVRPLDE